MLTIARTFGYPRETNYGTLLDVRVEPDPSNLARTPVDQRKSLVRHHSTPSDTPWCWLSTSGFGVHGPIAGSEGVSNAIRAGRTHVADRSPDKVAAARSQASALGRQGSRNIGQDVKVGAVPEDAGRRDSASRPAIRQAAHLLHDQVRKSVPRSVKRGGRRRRPSVSRTHSYPLAERTGTTTPRETASTQDSEVPKHHRRPPTTAGRPITGRPSKSPLLTGSKKAQVVDLGFAPPLGLEPRTLRLTAECSAS